MQGNKQKKRGIRSVEKCQTSAKVQKNLQPSLQKMYKPVGEDDVCLIKSTEKGILRGSYIL